MPYVDKMFDLFNESYAKLSSFVPISDRQKAYFKEIFKLLSPEYIKFVVNKVMNSSHLPSLCPLFLRHFKAKGKLFPFDSIIFFELRNTQKMLLFI